VLAALAAGWTLRLPSHERAWIPEHAVLPHARFAGGQVTIHGVRNFVWIDSTAVPAWEDRTYDLARIESVWFIVSPFSSEWRGPAHTFLSFGFADSQYVAISVEARKEVGETYSLWKGAAKRFEILYVIGDERDLIRLRTDVWGDDVYVYPIRASREHVRALFVQMLERANGLREQPEFYHTLTNNCTTNLIEHVNRIAPGTVPYGWRTLLPGYTDEVAEALGLLATDEPLEVARARFRVNERARAHGGDPAFSQRIRGIGPPRGATP
jgi:hypothetical protein